MGGMAWHGWHGVVQMAWLGMARVTWHGADGMARVTWHGAGGMAWVTWHGVAWVAWCGADGMASRVTWHCAGGLAWHGQSRRGWGPVVGTRGTLWGMERAEWHGVDTQDTWGHLYSWDTDVLAPWGHPGSPIWLGYSHAGTLGALGTIDTAMVQMCWHLGDTWCH